MSDLNKIEIIQDAMEDLKITDEPLTDFYILHEVIGTGKYGVVRKASSILNPDFIVAVKSIELSKLTGNYHNIVSEILTLKKVDHPNIVKIYEIFKDQKRLYIVMEY